MTNETSRLSIMWTDGTKTNNTNTSSDNVLNWYGILYNDVAPEGHKVAPKDLNWKTLHVDDDVAEFNIHNTASPYKYRALWTYRDQSNWPTAIRISFVLYDKAMAEGMQAKPEDGASATDINIEARKKRYEVICPIGR